MRFEHLLVESFQVLRRAEITFGPGLNVLYGPNDLGKSTLATAIRAVLLVPPTSSEAGQYLPWNRDDSPRVTLTFRDDQERFWRVRKVFSEGRTIAELDSSKNGRDYVSEAKGREVEDRLRKLLQWGIPSAGGKGAPRGLPESFLAKVLLAEQTDVEGILEASIAKDIDEGGKLRLVSALSAFAQNETLKKVLDRAQGEVNQFFTATGQRKRGKDSLFTRASERIKSVRQELAGLQEQLEHSEQVESRIALLKEQRAQCEAAFEDAKGRLDTTRKRLAAATSRAAVAAKVDEARNALVRMDAEAKAVADAEERVRTLHAGVADARVALDAAKERLRRAEVEAEAAKEAFRRATSDDADRDRELERGRIDADLARLGSSETELRARRDAATRVAAASDALERARKDHARLSVALEQAQRSEREARQQRAELENDLQMVRGCLAYGRWRTAREAADAVARVGREADALRREADENEAAAKQDEGRIPAGLPHEDELEAVRELARSLELAEGALGGGVSLRIAPRKPITVVATVDGRRHDLGTISDTRTVDAKASVRLSFGDLVDVDVEVGAPEARNRARQLRARWEEEGAPRLKSASASDIGHLVRMCAEVEAMRSRAREVQAKATSLRAEATHRDARVAELASQAALEPSRRELLPTYPFGERALEDAFKKVQGNWETELEQLDRKQQATLEAAAVAEQRAVGALRAAELEVKHVSEGIVELEAKLKILVNETGISNVQQTQAEIERGLERVAADRKKLDERRNALAAEASGKVSAAERALNEANSEVDNAKRRQQECDDKCQIAAEAYHSASGQLSVMKEQLARLDRAEAEDALRARAAELATMPEEHTTEDDIAAAKEALNLAEREFAETTRQLDQAEGALQSVGGAGLRDLARDLQRALEVEEEAEHQLEVEAQSWLLLRDTLREVENEEGTHIGRALARPVAERFNELTSKRYGELDLAPTREVQGPGGPGNVDPEEVLAALSVGTKDQLATLIRLTVAETLKSAIVLDDHLVHTDPSRLTWFRKALRETAARTQVIVLTCRPQDYVDVDELPCDVAARDLAGGTVRVMNLELALRTSSAGAPA